MNDKQIAIYFEKKLIKLQNSCEFRTRQAYNSMINDLSLLIDALKNNNPELIKNQITKLKIQFNESLKSLTYDYINKGFDIAYDKFINTLKYMLNDIDLEDDLYDKAINLYSKRINIKIDKHYISKNIWRINDYYFNDIKKIIDDGILLGKPANSISYQLKKYVKSPLPKKRGIYRDVKKNAVRLARTELKRGHQLQEHRQTKKLSFIKGIKVQLSNAHPEYDMCDELKGLYPPNFYFGSWHPNCICYTTIVRANKQEAKDIIKYGGQAQTFNMPDNYFQYLNKHKKRHIKNPPLFLKENKKLSDRFVKENNIKM